MTQDLPTVVPGNQRKRALKQMLPSTSSEAWKTTGFFSDAGKLFPAKEKPAISLHLHREGTSEGGVTMVLTTTLLRGPRRGAKKPQLETPLSHSTSSPRSFTSRAL
jgi:hypothetical protein